MNYQRSKVTLQRLNRPAEEPVHTEPAEVPTTEDSNPEQPEQPETVETTEPPIPETSEETVETTPPSAEDGKKVVKEMDYLRQFCQKRRKQNS